MTKPNDVEAGRALGDSGSANPTGRALYEADCVNRPTYHDGTSRKTWDCLGVVPRLSWIMPNGGSSAASDGSAVWFCEWCGTKLQNVKGKAQTSPGKFQAVGFCDSCGCDLWSREVEAPNNQHEVPK